MELYIYIYIYGGGKKKYWEEYFTNSKFHNEYIFANGITVWVLWFY